MEAEGVNIPPTTADVSSSTHDPDFSPVGSPDISDSHLDEVPQPSDEHHSSQNVILPDYLRDRIIKQVEYYFSDQNLQTDKFLMKYVTEDEEGFVPVAVIISFRKLKKLTQDRSLIVAALRESSLLVVSSDEKKVKRLHPLPFTDVKDPENLPEDHSIENIQRIFGDAGNVKNICIRDPNAAREPRKRTIAEKLLSGKLHALVEYETVEAAEKAVATLNDEQDWRYGMRVKLLKRMGKKSKKVWKGSDSEKSTSVAPDPVGEEQSHFSSEHHDDTHGEENEEHVAKEKNGHRGRNRGRARRQKYHHGSNGQGHGAVYSSHASETSKPPPGPRMPDGTRGFTMGRGRPLPSDQN